MVTIDAEQGVKLVQLIGPEVVVPVHYEYVWVFLFCVCFVGGYGRVGFSVGECVDGMREEEADFWDDTVTTTSSSPPSRISKKR